MHSSSFVSIKSSTVEGRHDDDQDSPQEILVAQLSQGLTWTWSSRNAKWHTHMISLMGLWMNYLNYCAHQHELLWTSEKWTAETGFSSAQLFICREFISQKFSVVHFIAHNPIWLIMCVSFRISWRPGRSGSCQSLGQLRNKHFQWMVLVNIQFKIQNSRLLYYLIREIKTWQKINHITVHNNTYFIC